MLLGYMPSWAYRTPAEDAAKKAADEERKRQERVNAQRRAFQEHAQAALEPVQRKMTVFGRDQLAQVRDTALQSFRGRINEVKVTMANRAKFREATAPALSAAQSKVQEFGRSRLTQARDAALERLKGVTTATMTPTPPARPGGPSVVNPGYERLPSGEVQMLPDVAARVREGHRLALENPQGGLFQPTLPESVQSRIRSIPIVGEEVNRVAAGMSSPLGLMTLGATAPVAPAMTAAGIGGTILGGLAGQGLESAGVPVVQTPIGGIGPRSVGEAVGGLATPGMFTRPGQLFRQAAGRSLQERGLPGTLLTEEAGGTRLPGKPPDIPTGAGVTSAEDELRNALRAVRPIRAQYEELKSTELARRAGRVEEVMQTSTPEDVRSKAFGAMRGWGASNIVNAPVHNLTPEHVTELTQQLMTSPSLQPFERLNAIQALDDTLNVGTKNLLTGKEVIPVPSGVKLLERVFPGIGEDINARLESMSAAKMAESPRGVSDKTPFPPEWGTVSGQEPIPGLPGASPLPPKGWAGTVGGNLTAIPGTSMAIKASFDLGTRFRQAMVLGWSHPRQWLSNWRPTFNALFSEKSAQATMARVRENPWATALHGPTKGLGFTDLGGHLYEWGDTVLGTERVAGFTGMNDSFIARAVRRIPGLRGSERAFAVDLNKQGVEVYAQEAQALWDMGIRDVEQYRNVVQVINHARGYGAFNAGQIAQGVNAFFSGRNLVAKFQVVLDPLTQPGSFFKPSARQLAAKNLVGMAAADLSLLGFLGGIGAMTGIGSVEFNPLNPGGDWLKYKIGNTRIDPWGGFAPLLRLIARMGAATVTEAGITDTGYDLSDIKRQTGDFFANKEAPWVRLFTDISGITEPLEGPRKLLSTKTLTDLYLPFLAEDVWDAVKHTDWGFGLPGLAAGLPSSVGIGVQTYNSYPVSVSVWDMEEYPGLTARQAIDINQFLGRVQTYRAKQVEDWGKTDSVATIIEKLAAKEGLDEHTINWAKALNKGLDRKPEYIQFLVDNEGALRDRYPFLYDSRDIQTALHDAKTGR